MIAALLVATGAATPLDRLLLPLILELRRDALTPVMLQITALGNGLTVSVVAATGATLLYLVHRRRAALFLLASTAGGMLLHWSLKPLIGRARPAEEDWLVTATTLSFPSGHAVNASVTYLAIAVVLLVAGGANPLARSAAALLVVVTLLVCLSRSYLGIHYPVDIGAGFALGVAWMAVCARSLIAPHPRRMVDPLSGAD